MKGRTVRKELSAEPCVQYVLGSQVLRGGRGRRVVASACLPRRWFWKKLTQGAEDWGVPGGAPAHAQRWRGGAGLGPVAGQRTAGQGAREVTFCLFRG